MDTILHAAVDVNGALVAAADPTVAVRHLEPDGAVLEFAGAWQSQHGLPEPASTLPELREAGIRHLAFDARQVTSWDSGLVTFVLTVLTEATTRAGPETSAATYDGEFGRT